MAVSFQYDRSEISFCSSEEQEEIVVEGSQIRQCPETEDGEIDKTEANCRPAAAEASTAITQPVRRYAPEELVRSTFT